MERTPNCCCTRASLVALVILVLFPVRSGCKEYTYKSLTEAKPECCVREDAVMKRLKDLDYDSFVGLMGRRSVAQPNRHMDHIFADMLGLRTGSACPCAEDYVETKRSQFISHGRQRFQRFLWWDVTPPPPQHRL
ncbi:tachykinin-3b [Anoplopoma fimbria]|uniref:tachykinin-3b n=1 Tax=Anoplopoma fimbria TaxID=229290 RepID=UPI0023EC0F7C|nr:tachykinin-3b [Anoplopoma fimbria]